MSTSSWQICQESASGALQLAVTCNGIRFMRVIPATCDDTCWALFIHLITTLGISVALHKEVCQSSCRNEAGYNQQGIYGWSDMHWSM